MLTTYDTFIAGAGVAVPPPAIADAAKRTLTGYAVVWGAVSTVTSDGYRHVYNRGSLNFRPQILGLWSHSLSTPLASTANGSLRYTEDDIGVRVEIDLLATTTVGNDTWAMVEAGLVRGMSFGAIIRAKTPTDDPTVLEITQADAVEFTVTVSPAMVDTFVGTSPEKVAEAMQDQQRRRAKYELERARLP